MRTIHDWVALVLFAGLVTLFLQRSAEPAPRRGDTLVAYAIPAIGIAVANRVGDGGRPLAAGALFAASIVWVLVLLKPFSER